MKKLIAAVAFATLVAVPAMAQSYDPSIGDGNVVPPPYGETVHGASAAQNDWTAFNARAEAPRGKVMRRSSDVVTDEAGKLQQDPDANIRSQLERENNEF